MTDKKHPDADQNDATMAKVDAAEDNARRHLERLRRRDEFEDKRLESQFREMDANDAHNEKVRARSDECWAMEREAHSFNQRRLALDLERNELWKADRVDTAARFDSYEKRLAQQGEALMTMAAALSKFADVAIKQAGVKS